MPPMLKNLFRFLGSRPDADVPPTVRQAGAQLPAAKPVPVGVPVYPPIDRGVDLGRADAVLATQNDLVKRLRTLAGLPPDQFEALYGGVLRSLANYVDLLPASESGSHNGAGGLFRFALEMAFYSRQACEAVLFAGRVGVEVRRDLEPRWRYATFLAGLCCELHRPLSRMIVVTANGQEWPVHRGSLSEWLSSIGEQRYFVRWVKDGDAFAGGSATFLATKIIPETSLQYLQEGHPNIIPAMLDAIVADVTKTRDNPIAEIIDRMRRKVIERDQVLAPQNYGKLTVGAQLEPHLIDAMRQLVSAGTWAINAKKSRLWYGRDGLFIVWRTAAKEMLEVLARSQVSGIPRDATTIAEVLLRAGVFVPDRQGDLYWKIKTPLSDSELFTVRLANPETLLVAIEEGRPAALDTALAIGSDQREGGRASTSTATVSGMQNEGAPQPPAPVAEQASNLAAAAPPPPQSSAEPQAHKEGGADTAAGSPAEAKQAPAGKSRGRGKSEAEELAPGAIAAVAENAEVEMAQDVASRMTLVVREVVAQIMKDFNGGRLRDSAVEHEAGLAIALEQMAAYGVELKKIMVELHGLGWLYPDPVKPDKKLHMVQIRGKSVQAAVFKRQAALDLGFVLP